MTNPTRKELQEILDSIVEKFNPNHDKLGRFTTGSGNVTGSGSSKQENKSVKQLTSEYAAKAKEIDNQFFSIEDDGGNMVALVEQEQGIHTELTELINERNTTTDSNRLEELDGEITELVERAEQANADYNEMVADAITTQQRYNATFAEANTLLKAIEEENK